MRTFVFLLIIIFIGVITSDTVLSAPNAVAKVDKYRVDIADFVILTIDVTGARQIKEPELMGLENFSVISTSKGQNIAIVNGVKSESMTFRYMMVPTRTGTLPIGEAYIHADGQRIYLKPLLIEAIDNSVSQSNQQTQSNTVQTASTGNDNFFMEAFVDNKKPYVNEQMIYTIKVFYMGNLNQSNLELPDFKDFIVEPLDNIRQYASYDQGAYYSVIEQSYALFPNKAGKIIIPPARVKGSLVTMKDPLGSIFGNQQVQAIDVKSPEVTIEVRNPPPAPPGYQNSVGDFQINTEINKTTLEVGETANLKINIWGKGNILNLQSPKFKFDENFKKNFKIYTKEPKPQITEKKDYIFGQVVFNYDIVALNPGSFYIPAAEYAYFNPEDDLYHQLRSSVIDIEVKPGLNKEQLGLTQSDNLIFPDDLSNQDIITIRTSETTLKDSTLNKNDYTFYTLLFMLPLCVVLITFIFIKRKERIEANTHLYIKRQAYRLAKDRLNRLRSYVKQSNSKEFFSQLDNIIKDYIGSKLYLPSKSLTSKDVEAHLKKINISQKTIIFTTEILSLCEISEFSTTSSATKKVSIAYKDAKKVLKLLEKELKK